LEVAAGRVVLVAVRAGAHRVGLAVDVEEPSSGPVVVAVAFTLSGDLGERGTGPEAVVLVERLLDEDAHARLVHDRRELLSCATPVFA
jgi:hypothetical protein